MASNNVRFYQVSTKAKFDALLVKDSLALYWIEETKELYKGSILFGTGSEASEKAAGLLSAADYIELKKLIAAGQNLIPVATIEVAGKVKASEEIAVAEDGKMSLVAVPLTKVTGLEARLEAIEKAAVGGIHYRGTVLTYEDLPTEGLMQGDLYEVSSTGKEYCWNGEAWFEYGSSHFVPVEGAGINVNGSEISIKLSDVEKNILRVEADGGLYVPDYGFTTEDKDFIDSIPSTYASKVEMEEAIAKAIEEAKPIWDDLMVNIVEFDGSAVDYTQNTAFQRAIKDLSDDSTVMLKNGNFRVAFLDEYSVPKNLTVIGGTNAVVTEFALETDVEGLTLRNLEFAENKVLSAAYSSASTIKGLTVDGCTFAKGAIHMGNATGSVIEDVVVSNCVINGAVSGFNGITLSNINGATVKGNKINNSADIGIALLGTISGIVDIEDNTIAGTGDRALRVNNVLDNAVITYKNNIISDCAFASVANEGLFKVTSTASGAFIIFNGNTYNSVAWTPNNISENSGAVVYTIA